MGAIAVSDDDERRIVRLRRKLGIRSKAGSSASPWTSSSGGSSAGRRQRSSGSTCARTGASIGGRIASSPRRASAETTREGPLRASNGRATFSWRR